MRVLQSASLYFLNGEKPSLLIFDAVTVVTDLRNINKHKKYRAKRGDLCSVRGMIRRQPGTSFGFLIAW